MGHRTGTPMRLVSPAPVLVPGAGPRPQAPPTIYQPPQPQGTPQTIYSQQNSSNVGGKRLHLFSHSLTLNLCWSFLCSPQSSLCLHFYAKKSHVLNNWTLTLLPPLQPLHTPHPSIISHVYNKLIIFIYCNCVM